MYTLDVARIRAIDPELSSRRTSAGLRGSVGTIEEALDVMGCRRRRVTRSPLRSTTS